MNILPKRTADTEARLRATERAALSRAVREQAELDARGWMHTSILSALVAATGARVENAIETLTSMVTRDAQSLTSMRDAIERSLGPVRPSEVHGADDLVAIVELLNELLDAQETHRAAISEYAKERAGI